MSEVTRKAVEAHWHHANARNWVDFEALLSPELQYEVPQTREYIESGAGYLDMFRTWPGAWRAVVKHLVAEDRKAICIVDFIVENEATTGISIFEVQDGKFVKVTDYWPEPYEPPHRSSKHMKRRPK
jgi:SnoaL-like domain